MERANRYGVHYIFQSMEQGPTFRCSMPKFPAQDPNHRILSPQRAAAHHQREQARRNEAVTYAIRSGDCAIRVASAHGGHSLVEPALGLPAQCNLPPDGSPGSRATRE
jgi:hypothetical protein